MSDSSPEYSAGGNLESHDALMSRRQLMRVGLTSLAGASLLHNLLAEEASAAIAPGESEPLKGITTRFFSPDANGTANTFKFVEHGGANAVLIFPADLSDVRPDRHTWNEELMRQFDWNVNAAKSLGVKVFAIISCNNPEDIQYRGRQARAEHGYAPKDLTPSGEFAEFIHYIATHWELDGIAPINEANGLIEDDQPDPQLVRIWGPTEMAASQSVEAIKTADIVLREAGFNGQLIVPNTADLSPDNDQGYKYTEAVLKGLDGWQSAIELVWGHHAYWDIMHTTVKGTKNAKSLVDQARPGTAFAVTEFGWKFTTKQIAPGVYAYDGDQRAQELDQAISMTRFMKWAKSAVLMMVSNFTYQDAKHGGKGWMTGLREYTGRPRLMLGLWKHHLQPTAAQIIKRRRHHRKNLLSKG